MGYDFSILRPRGLPATSVGAIASGPVSFMVRGAMMGTLSCNHPDIEEFIEVGRDPAALRNFNLSHAIPAKSGARDGAFGFGSAVGGKALLRGR